ncbi:hypothetical protein GOBAR_DD12020 [Gossypium barbadense]|nr:hypothetical protein GOBAR_DD12020 [Gossypium barbadense]
MTSSNTPIPVDDGFNKYESSLKRQKSTTSKVWDEMTKLECDNKNELKAQCNQCKTIFSAKSSSGTSHLRRHLNSCLKKVNKDITQYTIATQASPEGVPSIKKYKFDADECRKAISTFLVCGKHSFRTVEEPGFRYMMRIVSPNFKNIYVLDYWGQRDKDYQMFALSNEEWRNFAILCKFLKVFYDVTCIFSGSNYPTANLYFRGVWKVHKVLLDTVKDFVETILCNLRLLFDEYVKKSKSTSSSLAGSSNVSDKNPVDSGLDGHNDSSVDFVGYFDESDYYKRYLNESSTRSEKSQLDIYLEEPELELNSQIDVLDYWSKKFGCKKDDEDGEDDDDDEDNEDGDVSLVAF